MSSGRPPIFTEEIAEEVLDRLANGESVVQIGKAEDMPSARTIMKWVADNESEFAQRYARAREVQAEFMDDLVIETAKKAKDDPQAARVQIDAYKWRAAKLAPKQYGDSSTIRHADADGEKLALDDVGRATRLAAIFAGIEARKGDGDSAD